MHNRNSNSASSRLHITRFLSGEWKCKAISGTDLLCVHHNCASQLCTIVHPRERIVGKASHWPPSRDSRADSVLPPRRVPASQPIVRHAKQFALKSGAKLLKRVGPPESGWMFKCLTLNCFLILKYTLGVLLHNK